MNKNILRIFFILVAVGAILILALNLYGMQGAVLNPKGLIASKEFDLLVVSSVLMLLVVLPVFAMTLVIAWKYRADKDNHKAPYTPDWDYDPVAETIWWGFPCLAIIALAVITWKDCHALDPFKPLDTGQRPLKVQVVALDWKWLFIYPEEKIATLNYLKIPEQTPVHFEITADAPMNSFWIPALGGQIYAMPGMNSQLHLIANETGNFFGASANLSGKGFAGMRFQTYAIPAQAFSEWVQSIQKSAPPLNDTSYSHLVLPSENVPPASFVLENEHLYNQIIMKYMEMQPNV